MKLYQFQITYLSLCGSDKSFFVSEFYVRRSSCELACSVCRKRLLNAGCTVLDFKIDSLSLNF